MANLQHKASCNIQVLFSSREGTEGPVQGFLLLSQHPGKSLLISAWCSKGFGTSPAIRQQGRQKGVLFSTRFKSRAGSLTPGYPSKASRDTKWERLTGRVAEEHLHDHHLPSWEWYKESVGQPWGHVLTEKGLSVPTSSHQYPVPPLPGQVGIIAWDTAVLVPQGWTCSEKGHGHCLMEHLLHKRGHIKAWTLWRCSRMLGYSWRLMSKSPSVQLYAYRHWNDSATVGLQLLELKFWL